MSKQRLMTAMDTKRMLATLYPELAVAETEMPIERDDSAIYGTYIDDADEPVSLCAVDWAFAAHLGSALTMIPAPTAASAAKTGDFSDTMTANLREVFNILSRLYMDGSSPHLRFAELKTNRTALSAGEANVIDQCAARLDLRIEIPGYGAGNCSLITL